VIDDLFVEGEAREVGVGEEMTKVVVEWCEERGCRGIDANVLPGDRATKNFFESFGFTARAITVHRRLPGAHDS
jgi:L-amino acid N-acyltransferase YncA